MKRNYFVYANDSLDQLISDSIKKEMKHFNSFQIENYKLEKVVLEDFEIKNIEKTTTIQQIISKKIEKSTKEYFIEFYIDLEISLPQSNFGVCSFYDENNFHYIIENSI